jgi:hypothetical protein
MKRREREVEVKSKHSLSLRTRCSQNKRFFQGGLLHSSASGITILKELNTSETHGLNLKAIYLQASVECRIPTVVSKDMLSLHVPLLHSAIQVGTLKNRKTAFMTSNRNDHATRLLVSLCKISRAVWRSRYKVLSIRTS